MNRRKAIVKPIPVSDADRQFLNSVLASSKSPLTKHMAVRKVVGGYCSSCGAIASQKAIFDAHGATVIEKYCDSCVKQMKFAAK
jgi:hypothetical protein